MGTLEVLDVGADRAHDVLDLIHVTFAGRPVLDPPSTALEETIDSVTRTLARYGGLLALLDGRPVGALLLDEDQGLLGVHRVGVLAPARRHGVASALARRAEEVAGERKLRGLELEARRELPATVRFWEGHGYVETGHRGPRLRMTRLLPLTTDLPRAVDTRAVGERLGRLLRAGDLVILTGDLGAGKTTLTQGLGLGLGVRGAVTSPTFVISRIHPAQHGGPPLVHVDAYRLGGTAELDDLDLDTDVEDAVTVVEWGEGLAEALTGDRLEIRLQRPADPSSEVRTLTMTAVGARWRDADLSVVLLPDAD
jgi:tRNA threonylcarbamoyladenosine biosynthesis protein TsaE